MPRYEIESDGKRYEVEAPDEATAIEAVPKPMGWGEYARRVGGRAVNSALFEYGDELGLVDREADKEFQAQYPGTSIAASLAGGVAPFVAGPGAALARGAMAAPTLMGRVGRSAGIGGVTGMAAGIGAGEGDLANRAEGGHTGALAGTVIGAAAPPVIGAASRIAGATVAPFLSATGRAFQRAPREPQLPFSAFDNIDPATGRVVEGARFINDMTPGQVAGPELRGIDWINDVVRRRGMTPEQVRDALLRSRSAARPYHEGQAPDRTFIADVDQSLQRGAGVLARKSTDAAQDMVNMMEGRQTGMTPTGASQADMARRGIMTYGRMDEPMTGAQAAGAFGSQLGASQKGRVVAGLRGSIRDYLDRYHQIRDKTHHGFELTGIETMEQAAQKADSIVQAQLAAATKAHAATNFRKLVDDTFERFLMGAAVKEAPIVEAAVRAAHQSFRPGKPLNLAQFHNIKITLDNRIDALLDKPATRHVGGILNEVKNALLEGVDAATGRDKSLYRQYRMAYREVMQDMESYIAGRRAGIGEKNAVRQSGPLRDLDADEQYYLREFQAYDNAGQSVIPNAPNGGDLAATRQKLWRQGFNDGLLSRLPKNPKSSDLKLLNEDRVRFLMRETAPTETRNRVGALGGDTYIDWQMRMPETRHQAAGNSLTAQRLQDDLMDIATEAMTNVQTFTSLFRGNQSLYQLGERIAGWIADRAYGTAPDTARQAARYLFTANPAEQDQIIRLMIERWGVDRMGRFNQLVGQTTQRMVAPASTIGGSMAGATTPPQPQQGGPTLL